jgi:opacity protein-like surface antigen
MKKWMIGIMVVMFAASAMAQILGLPVGGGAAAPEAGAWRVSGGGVFNGDLSLYGGRVSYAPIKGLSVFGDAGALDIEKKDIGLAFQGGAQYTLPLDLPVDLALRASAGMGSADEGNRKDDVKMTTFNGGLLASKTFELFTPYAFIGVSFLDAEARLFKSNRTIQYDETDIMLAGGVSVAPSEQLSVYLEVAFIELTEWIDDAFFAAGVRWAF